MVVQMGSWVLGLEEIPFGGFESGSAEFPWLSVSPPFLSLSLSLSRAFFPTLDVLVLFAGLFWMVLLLKLE